MKIKRNIIKRLEAELSEPKISILLGARQVGKTTLLHDIEEIAQKDGKKTAFYDLESSADLMKLSGDQQSVIDQILSGGEVVFIDEFHYLKNASKIFKAIYDQKAPVKIFATGSSSMEIHKHLKESLAGRFYRTMIFPLTLSEIEQIPKTNIGDYLQWGGLPELAHCKTDDQKSNILENIVSTYITKDIKSLIREENIRGFNTMLYLLATNQGSLVVKSEIAREVGISEPTVSRHLEILRQTYVCHMLNSFSGNLGNELKKSIKSYFFDIGIRNCLVKDFRLPAAREDKGTLNETFVFLHMYKQLKPNMEIRFWRTKKGEEVDFILIKNRVPVPVEVKSNLKDCSIPSGIKAFLRAYPKAPFGIVFNETQTAQCQFEGRTVYFQRLEESEKIKYLQTVV